MEPLPAEQIIIVFADRTRRTMPEQEARRICSDKKTAGRIIDALTDNKPLQTELRQIIDSI